MKLSSLAKISWLLNYRITSIKICFLLIQFQKTRQRGSMATDHSWLEWTKIGILEPRPHWPCAQELAVWWARADLSQAWCMRENISFPFDYENKGWINATLLTILPANFWVSNKCQVLKYILSLSHCNDPTKVGGFFILQTQPGLGRMALLDRLPNQWVSTGQPCHQMPDILKSDIWSTENLKGQRGDTEAIIL